MMKRILEPESMGGMKEALAYDRIMRSLGGWMEREEVKGLERHLFTKLQGGRRILDLGCGTGNVSVIIGSRYPEHKIYAVDISEEALKIARHKAREEGVGEDRLVFMKGDAKRLSFEGGFFDGAMCVNMLHHIEEPIVVLRQLRRTVKDGGIICIADLIRPPSLNPWLIF